MTDNNTEENIRLGFVDISVFPDGAIRGAILVTDIETRPYEFRVTSPVKPTQLQQVLYGSALREYVYGELICAPLVKAAKEKISLVIVKERNLLTIRDSHEMSIPLVMVSTEAKSIKSGDGKEGIKPVTISAHRKYPGEEAWAETILSQVTQQHDLMEPFERIHTALSEVHKQRVEDKASRA